MLPHLKQVDVDRCVWPGLVLTLLLHCQCPLQGLRQLRHPSSILGLPVLVFLTLRELGPVGFLPLSSTHDVAKEGVLTNRTATVAPLFRSLYHIRFFAPLPCG